MTEQPDYVLTRDYLDNNRINLQHYVFVELFGYHIHPQIPIDRAPLKVADVGTGTAIWLTDLARKLPETVQLDGLDVSFDAAPPSPWLPPNVTFRHFDVTKPVPQELVGMYDIVHIRMFCFVLVEQQLPTVLKNLMCLLSKIPYGPVPVAAITDSTIIEPGGYLQWGDADVVSWKIETTSPSNKTDALQQLYKLSVPQDSRLQPRWIASLPQLFVDAGFEQVVSDLKKSPPPVLELAMHECNLLIHELIVRKTKDKKVEAALKTLMPEVAHETRMGSYWAFEKLVVIGRKHT